MAGSGNTKGIEVVPSAKRLIKSLRDMGYDFVQAVADLIDNSIEAGAHTVWINAEFEGDDSWVSVSDDGHGMTPDRLREAMRYGTERDYELEDLGKFGLGLKVASLSQCERLTVASRVGSERARVTAYTWDLDHIEKTNRWEILQVDTESLPKAIQGRLGRTTGTIVLWQRLERILGCKHPYGEVAKKRFAEMSRDLERHLAMVFHRFLAGEVRGKKLRIFINDENEVAPWDPFCRTEKNTKKLKPSRFLLEDDGVSGEVYLQPYILPSQVGFSSSDAFKLASGPANWNQQQGIYIYRANRLIQGGGWCHFRAPDEHTKLARIALDFSRDLDEAFKLNVAKMRVILPSQIRSDVDDVIGPVVKMARQVYDKGERKKETEPPTATQPPAGTFTPASREAHAEGPMPNAGLPASPAAPVAASPAGDPQVGEELLSFEQWSDRVLAASAPAERPILSRIIDRIRGLLAPAPAKKGEATT